MKFIKHALFGAFKLYLPCVILTCLLVSVVYASDTNKYVDNVCLSLDALSQKKSKRSIELLTQALDYNQNDPLAHTALGMALILGGKVDEAAIEFHTAVALDGNRAEPVYGLGLVQLAKAHIDKAGNYFLQARIMNPGLDIRQTLEYLKTISSDTYIGSFDDESLSALSPIWLMRQSKYSEALKAWGNLIPYSPVMLLDEPVGSLMTYEQKSPAKFIGAAINTVPRNYNQLKASSAKVFGSVVLKADLKKAKNIYLVSFYIDNNLIGITNTSPFAFEWDTVKYPNGLHTIRIEGADVSNSIVSRKTIRVFVNNKDSVKDAILPDVDTVKAWKKLWKLMCLKPSFAAAYNGVSLCYKANGNVDKHIGYLEKAVAVNPGNPILLQNYINLCARTGAGKELVIPRSKSRVVSLTFSIAANDDIDTLLNVLKNKKVKATLFVTSAYMKKNIDAIKKAYADGNDLQLLVLGNNLSENQYVKQIVSSSAVLRSITGKGAVCIKPQTKNVSTSLKNASYKLGMYIAESGKTYTDSDYKQNKTIKIKSGDIIQVSYNKDAYISSNMLTLFIDDIKSQGFSILRVQPY